MYDELEQVLNSVDNTAAPPLWIYIRDNYEKITQAHERGVTYKKMALALNVTPRSFSIALKKARAAAAHVEQSENKKITAKQNKSKSFSNNDVDFELPPPPGSKKKSESESGGGFIDLV